MRVHGSPSPPPKVTIKWQSRIFVGGRKHSKGIINICYLSIFPQALTSTSGFVDWQIRSKYVISSTYYQFIKNHSARLQLDSKKPLSTTDWRIFILDENAYQAGLDGCWNSIEMEINVKIWHCSISFHVSIRHIHFCCLGLSLFSDVWKKGEWRNIGFLSRWRRGQNHYVISLLSEKKNLKIQQSFYLFCNLVM